MSIRENMEKLEQLAVAMAHEIKNPLALALANLELIRVSDTTEKYKKYCNIIKQELYRVNQQIIDFVHSTHSDGADETFDITTLLDELTLEYQRRYENITFCRKDRISPSPFRGVKKSIKMVFTNVLNNAVDAISHKGNIEILQKKTLSWLHIIIEDDGIGLDENMLQPNFISTKENGTGIGLAYCRSTVAKYGGRFMIQNRTQGGCSVSIVLPI